MDTAVVDSSGRLFRGLEFLVKHGVKPRHITVYILLGYWPWSDLSDWEYRRQHLREFGVRPYPMPFHRTKESVGFQRWVCGAYDKRVPWKDWEEAGYRPEKITLISRDGWVAWNEYDKLNEP